MNFLVAFSDWNFTDYIVNFFSGYFDLILFALIDNPIFTLTLLVLTVGKWKIFQKAGINGWKAVIPVYSEYILCKVAVDKIWPFIIRVIGILYCAIIFYLDFATMFSHEMDDFLKIARPIGTIVFMVLIIVRIYIMYKLSRSFGYSALIAIMFTIGLVVLEPIFLCILGFNGAKYIGSDNVIYNSYVSKNQKE